MIPTLPFRVGFLCPDLDVAGHTGDSLCELVLQWMALALVQSDRLVVIPPQRFGAVVDGVRQTHTQCEAEEGLAERYMHARIDEVAWLELDSKTGKAILYSRRLLADIEEHGEMSGPFSDVVSTLLGAWARGRGLGSVVEVIERVEWADFLAAASVLDRVQAAVDTANTEGALALAKGPLSAALIAVAVRRARVQPDERLLETSAPRTVRALRGDALAYATFAWSLAPDDAQTLLALAEMLFARGRFAEAQRMADRASRVAPGMERAHALAVRATASLGRLGEAYQEALERQAILAETLEETQVGAGFTVFSAALAEARAALREPQQAALQRGDFGAARTPAALVLLEHPRKAQAALARASHPRDLLTLAEAYACDGQEAAALWLLAHVRLAAPQSKTEIEHGRILRLLSSAPLEALENAIAATSSHALRTLLARDAADAHPGAKNSGVITDALGDRSYVEYSEAWLDPLREALGDRVAPLDRVFTTQGGDALREADRMVGRWHGLSERFASEIGLPNPDNPDLAPTLTYVATQAVARYLALSTDDPSPLSLAYRQIAVEALAAARVVMFDADEAALVLLSLEPALAAAETTLADTWLALLERAFDVELVLGGHRDAYCEGLDRTRALFLGDEHLGAFYAQARGPSDFARLARHTGDAAAYDKSGELELPRLVRDPLGVVNQRFPAPPLERGDADPTRATGLRKLALLALEASELARAKEIAEKAVALEPEDWTAWLALLVATAYRAPGTGSELPLQALKLARTVMELSAGCTGGAAARLRIFASRVIESRCFALDRPAPVE